MNPEDETKRRQELATFLRTRRERIQPEDVGLPSSTRRRTPGLRREEVALLANISMDWYTRLEQGRDIRVSDQVLESIANVLHLTSTERKHLYILAFGHQPPPAQPVNMMTSELHQFLEQQGIIPTFIMGYCWDVLAWNESASWLFGGFERIPQDDRNIAMMTFLPYTSWNKRSLEEWENHAKRLLAQFRSSYGKYVHDTRFNALVERLKQVDPDFADWWEQHHVLERETLHKRFHHPEVGLLELTHMTLIPSEQPDLKIVIHLPVAGTGTLEKIENALKNYELS